MPDEGLTKNVISGRNHCQRPTPWQISHIHRAIFEHVLSLSSGLIECCCAVVITTIPYCRKYLPAVASYINIELTYTSKQENEPENDFLITSMSSEQDEI